MEQSMVERAIVSRQEAIICDLENKLEFQRVQIKRFEVGGPPGLGEEGREVPGAIFVPDPVVLSDVPSSHKPSHT